MYIHNADGTVDFIDDSKGALKNVAETKEKPFVQYNGKEDAAKLNDEIEKAKKEIENYCFKIFTDSEKQEILSDIEAVLELKRLRELSAAIKKQKRELRKAEKSKKKEKKSKKKKKDKCSQKYKDVPSRRVAIENALELERKATKCGSNNKSTVLLVKRGSRKKK